MASKTVVKREKASRVVEGAGEVNAARMAAALTERLAPALAEGETMPDLELFAELLRRTLIARREALLTADEAFLRSRVAASGPRRRRDLAAQRVREVVFALRGSVDRFYPLGTAASLFGIVDGPTAADPAMVLHRGKDMLERLQSSTFTFPQVQLQGLVLQPEGLAAELAGPVAELAEALAEVQRANRAEQNDRTARRAAQQEHDAAVDEVAALYSALFEAAGLNDVARTVRPSVRRSAKPEEQEGTTPPAEGPATTPPVSTPAVDPAN